MNKIVKALITGVAAGAVSGVVIHCLKKLDKANKFNPDDFKVNTDDLSSLDKFFGTKDVEINLTPDVAWGTPPSDDDLSDLDWGDFDDAFEDTVESDSPTEEAGEDGLSWVDSDSDEFLPDDGDEATYERPTDDEDDEDVEEYSDEDIFKKLNKVSRDEARLTINKATGRDATYLSDEELSQAYNDIKFEEGKEEE